MGYHQERVNKILDRYKDGETRQYDGGLREPVHELLAREERSVRHTLREYGDKVPGVREELGKLLEASEKVREKSASDEKELAKLKRGPRRSQAGALSRDAQAAVRLYGKLTSVDMDSGPKAAAIRSLHESMALGSGAKNAIHSAAFRYATGKAFAEGKEHHLDTVKSAYKEGLKIAKAEHEKAVKAVEAAMSSPERMGLLRTAAGHADTIMHLERNASIGPRGYQSSEVGPGLTNLERESRGIGAARRSLEEAKARLDALSTEPKGPASPNDIPRQLAVSAHSGTSHTPERRADMVQREYAEHVNSLHDRLISMAQTDEQRAKATEAVKRYKAAYTKRLKGLLESQSRVMSTLVVGPAKFPSEQMRKRNQTVDNKRNDLIEWSNKAQKRIEREVMGRPDDAPVAVGESDAVSRIRKKREEREKTHETMKAVNRIVKRKKGTDEEKIREIVEKHGMSEAGARALFQPDFAGRKGFPSYLLKNNGAEIRRLKQQEEAAKQAAARPSSEKEFDGGTVIDNADANRVQIAFDSKPDADTIRRLKSRGFRWSRNEGAWQRQRTNAANQAVKEITGVEL